MYFNDSVAMLVYAYDFDLESGNISNKRILVDRRSSFGEPDGWMMYGCREYAGWRCERNGIGGPELS